LRSLSALVVIGCASPRDGADDAELAGRDQLALGEDERPFEAFCSSRMLPGHECGHEEIARLPAEAGLEHTTPRRSTRAFDPRSSSALSVLDEKAEATAELLRRERCSVFEEIHALHQQVL